MKELSIEEKAKRYDEAIERASKLRVQNPFDTVSQMMEHVFPELAESDDERIRKVLLNDFKNNCSEYYCEGVNRDMIISWLEKQGEQKLDDVDNKFIRMRETKPKDISEFLNRLTTVEQEFLWEHIAKIRELDKEEQKPAWSEEDEKMRAAVLQLITDSEKENGWNCVYCNDKEIYFSDIIAWLKSLKDRVQPQPKQEWSEKDEQEIEEIIDILTARPFIGTFFLQKHITWLKSLRPQKQCAITEEELSIAKKDAYNEALDKIEYSSGEPTFDDGWSAAIWYLKKRNTMSQTTWKPSDEQMEALKEACDEHWEPDGLDPLYTLYQDLKKLKGKL